ncbi:hypothetical protein IMAU80174_03024 [Lactiplantibacillus plantarum]|nr:hypothetical protein [Lactiplantibacillus plantarum]MCG0694510.1 hypothetical protein [Lactiplantibacillus plantarum]
MKKVLIYSPQGTPYFVECDTEQEFNNLFRNGWVGDGTPWKELPEDNK